MIHRYAPADPLNIARADYFATHTAHADTVIVGDSIPRGIEWSEYFPGVVNRAINSDSSADVLKRIGPLKAMHARRYIVMLGPNDIAMRVPPERFGANMRRIVRELPGSVVVQIASCGGCDPSPYNAELHKLGVPVAPLTLEPSDLVDRVHPKASGMDKIVAAVRPFIK